MNEHALVFVGRFSSPCSGSWDEYRPGEQPDKKKQPESEKRERPENRRFALSDKSQELLAHKEKMKESLILNGGKPVPGYRIRLVAEDGREVGPNEMGELQIHGPSAAAGYWNNREKTRSTFLGEWTRAGDNYSLDEDGYYTYAGRSDDMLKVGGIYVSPFEVEAALMTHPSVLEAAVIGQPDKDQLIKPKAYVVPKPGTIGTRELAEELKAYVKSRLAPYKYPRWVEFVPELPKTATGKIQRFVLRSRANIAAGS